MATQQDTTKKPTKPAKPKRTAKANYLYSVGRRKTAIARVRLYPNKKGGIIINEEPAENYFADKVGEKLYLEPLRSCNVIDKYLITVKVSGSGKTGQLEAVVHGIARVLVKLNEEKFKPILKKRGFLTRDPRMRERRKPGMGGKARRKRQSPRR